MAALKKKGKGIILMHDLHKWTALAVPELLAQLKANGYKVVHVRAKDTLATLPEYDTIVVAAVQPVKSSNVRAISAVVQTVDCRRRRTYERNSAAPRPICKGESPPCLPFPCPRPLRAALDRLR